MPASIARGSATGNSYVRNATLARHFAGLAALKKAARTSLLRPRQRTRGQAKIESMTSRPQFCLLAVFGLMAIIAAWCMLAQRRPIMAGEGLFVISATFIVVTCRRFKPWILIIDPTLGLGWGLLLDEVGWLPKLQPLAGVLLGGAAGFVVMVVRVSMHYRQRVD